MIISPEQMALIYGNRMHRAAFWHVQGLLNEVREATFQTRNYWKAVLDCLDRRFGGP